MNETENRVVSYSHLPDSNISCVPAFATRLSHPISNEVEKPCSGTDGEKTQWKKEKTFPWLNSFSKQCCAAVGNKSVKQLENLLNLYIQHVTPHYIECQKLPNKAFKLKRSINETMVFLHLLYSDLHEPLENGFYHEKMAEVMAMYLDLEITAFRRGKDTAKEVYNRLSSTLYIFLDHSDDHILDALLRTQLVNKHSKNLCSPFLRKVLTELVVCRPLSAVTYVRYVLAFKLWKSVVAEANEKKLINKIALQRLLPPPKFFQDHDIAKPSAEILPKVPKNKKNSSQFYLQAKFNLKDALRAFFRFCKETNCQEEPVYLPSFSEKTEEVEHNGCLSLINEIWSTMSNDTCDDMPLLGKSEVFSEDRMFCDDTSLCESEEVFIKTEAISESCKKVESPDSGVCLDSKKRKRSNDGEIDKVPDSTYVMYPDSQELKSGGDESTDVDGSVAETISETTSPEPSSTVRVVPGDLSLSQQASESDGRFRTQLPDRNGELDARNMKITAPPTSPVAEISQQGSSIQSPTSSVKCLQNSTAIKEGKLKECVDVRNRGEFSVQLSASSRLEGIECSAPYPTSPSTSNVSLQELRSETMTYQEVLRSGDLAELEWRRYSDFVALSENYKTKLDVSLDEQMSTDDADSRNHHLSLNCHLPLKKRKLAASSNGSPTMDSKGYPSPYSESDYQTKVLELAIREEKRDFVVEGDKYKFAPWDSMAESRDRELERRRFHSCGRSNSEFAPFETRWHPEKCAPADLTTKTNSTLRSCLEHDFSQRKRSCEVSSTPEVHSSPQNPVGVGKLDGSHISAEVPDNLTILAEEAARIWEERAHGANEQIPFEVFTSQRMKMKGDYMPAGCMMMSLAEALENSDQKKLEESVIVRNDQYQYYKDQSKNRTYSNTTRYHGGSNKSQVAVLSYEDSLRRGERNHRVNGEKPQGAVFAKTSSSNKKELVNGGDYREHKPIDMSGRRNDSVGLPYSRTVCDKNTKAFMLEKSACSTCKLSVCKGKCKFVQSNAVQGTLSRQQVTLDKVSCSNCRSQGCNGKKCKAVMQSGGLSVHHVDVSKKSCSNSNSEQIRYKKCSYCKNASCDGTCKSAAKNPSSESKVLKCAHCKFAHCNGSCRTNALNAHRSTVCQYCKKTGCDSSRCLFARPETKKCDVCKSFNCKGKCKANQNSSHKRTPNQEVHTYAPTKIAKCNYCKSTCFGTCRLAEKNQLNRCNVCNMAGCKGKCNVGAACFYCSQKNCSGACRIHHSVDSILGPPSKVPSSVSNERPVRRRTRNSQPVLQTKSRTPVQEEKSAPESKRRKKSVSR